MVDTEYSTRADEAVTKLDKLLDDWLGWERQGNEQSADLAHQAIEDHVREMLERAPVANWLYTRQGCTPEWAAKASTNRQRITENDKRIAEAIMAEEASE